MITLQIEQFSQTRNDELNRLHYLEVAKNRDKIALAPDDERYHSMEDVGQLVCFTARDGDKLVGYSIFIVNDHLHYKNNKFAFNDVIYVHPDYRKGTTIGKDLIEFAEKELVKFGVDKMTYHVKLDHDWSAMLVRKGYAREEVIVSKFIGESLWQ